MITDILPRPQKITIQGKEFVVGELTFDDYADFQNFIKERVPHPLVSIREHMEGLRPEERKLLLEMAYADAGEYPPKYGSVKGKQIMMTPEGIAFQVHAILKKRQNITEAECRELASKMTPDEFTNLVKLACNVTPQEEIESEGNTPDPKEVSPPITSN